MKILVTGNAGFIGFHTARRLLERGDSVVGVDSVNDYYGLSLKEARLHILEETAIKYRSYYSFIHGNLANWQLVEKCFGAHKFDRVIHLAAQAGVRHSLENPQAYVESNIIAFTNVLEACRRSDIPHLTYASTSSVYGASTKMPFSEHEAADHPLQFYAATKRSNELMAHSYSHLFRLPTTGLRFFTVYGPWGRPDMALFRFTRNILAGQPISLFNNGNHSRDFTYIDDVVESLIRVSDLRAEPNPAWNGDSPVSGSSNAPYRIYNVGNNNPTSLLAYVDALEQALDRRAVRNLVPMQPGDIANTYADTSALAAAVGYTPATSVREGVRRFVEWYLNYYKSCPFSDDDVS